jgi:predicted nucleotide-binding protein
VVLGPTIKVIEQGAGEESETEEEEEQEEQEEEEKGEKPSAPVATEQLVKQIFVAHGKNKVPLDQLKAILTEFMVPFQVAIDEPHMGRPISEKVAQLMRECSSGIFIFTGDEETTNAKGEKTTRPSDNVVFELGAGTILYGTKIVIFREDGVIFGSDFTAYGHITFEKDRLNAKTLELMRELIALGLVKFAPT